MDTDGMGGALPGKNGVELMMPTGQPAKNPRKKNRMNNFVALDGNICVRHDLTYSTSGKPILKFCLAVPRTEGGFLPTKVRLDGSEEPDYPWASVAGSLAQWLSNNLHVGDEVSVKGGLTTRNVDGKEMVLVGSLLEQLRLLLSQFLDEQGEIPVVINPYDVPESLDAVAPHGERASMGQIAKFLMQYLASNAIVRKRVITEVEILHVNITREGKRVSVPRTVASQDAEESSLANSTEANPSSIIEIQAVDPSKGVLGSELPTEKKKKKKYPKHSPGRASATTTPAENS